MISLTNQGYSQQGKEFYHEAVQILSDGVAFTNRRLLYPEVVQCVGAVKKAFNLGISNTFPAAFSLRVIKGIELSRFAAATAN
jgi:hypothetical protein